MEESKLGNEKPKDNNIYYDVAANYWSQIPPTVEGMLGGFGFISRTDVKGSQTFLKHLFVMKNPPGRGHAADCGAGIGRVTKNLLIKFFKEIDLIEQNAAFLEEAKNFIGPSKNKINCYNVGLQDFSPELDTYDVIWSQWVLGHLTNEDLVGFFKSCKRGLKPNGVIIVKENITSTDKVEVDEEDSSVTRPLPLLRNLYEQAGLKCIREEKQTNFPRGIYQVRMFALRPVQEVDELEVTTCNQECGNLRVDSANPDMDLVMSETPRDSTSNCEDPKVTIKSNKYITPEIDAENPHLDLLLSIDNETVNNFVK